MILGGFLDWIDGHEHRWGAWEWVGKHTQRRTCRSCGKGQTRLT